jgi:hypothetical protein
MKRYLMLYIPSYCLLSAKWCCECISNCVIKEINDFLLSFMSSRVVASEHGRLLLTGHTKQQPTDKQFGVHYYETVTQSLVDQWQVARFQ